MKISLDLYDKYENATFTVTLDDVEKGKPNPDMLYLIQKNVDSMVAAVKKFIELPYEDKVKMGKAAREKMEREFDREIVSNIYVEEIGRILQ